MRRERFDYKCPECGESLDYVPLSPMIMYYCKKCNKVFLFKELIKQVLTRLE